MCVDYIIVQRISPRFINLSNWLKSYYLYIYVDGLSGVLAYNGRVDVYYINVIYIYNT